MADSQNSHDDPVALEIRAQTDAMLFSPSAARNRAVIAEALDDLFAHGWRVLELGSGTGEHAEAICARRGDLVWTPSDPDAASRASCAARAALSHGAIRPPLAIDLTAPDWDRLAPSCDAIFCANTIHIAPWEAAVGLADGAARLAPRGWRRRTGALRFTARSLRARTPRRPISLFPPICGAGIRAGACANAPMWRRCSLRAASRRCCVVRCQPTI